MIGFLARRNLIIMFLSAEMMLQGVAINLVAFARYRGNLQGQAFTLFIITVAACEAAIALALILMLFRRKGSLDVSLWQELREPEPGADRGRGAVAAGRRAGADAAPDAGRPRTANTPKRRAMSDVRPLLWLIPALPLAAAVLTAFLGPKFLRGQSHWPCILAAAGACVLSLIVFCAVLTPATDAKPVQVHPYYTVVPRSGERRSVEFQPAGRRPDGHDAGDGHVHRHADRDLFDRLHARRAERRPRP